MFSQNHPSIPNANSLECPASLEQKQWITIGHVSIGAGDLREWKAGAEKYFKSMIPLETKAGIAIGDPTLNRVLSTATCAIYFQSIGYRAFDNSFNDW